VSENKKVIKSLTSLKTQMDNAGQTDSFADPKKIWKFMKPISLVDLVEKYNNLLEKTGEGLTSLKTQMDNAGQTHSFADPKKIWKFMKPISLVNRVEVASWYVIAFAFNIFGGVLGYFAVKDNDQNTANHLLIVGFISLFLLFILGSLGFIALRW
jgi:DNA-binding MltR family transcriptional regulator